MLASFRDNRNELSFTLDPIDARGRSDAPRPAAENSSYGVLTVASNTDYKVLGGAVANRLRAGEPTLLRAIGKRAVWAAARGVAVAGEYTATENTTLAFTPKLKAVQLANRAEPSTAIELLVYPLEDTCAAAPPPAAGPAPPPPPPTPQPAPAPAAPAAAPKSGQ